MVAALAEVDVELVLIPSFREGNGRISRLLSVLMALQAGLPTLADLFNGSGFLSRICGCLWGLEDCQVCGVSSYHLSYFERA